MHPPIKSVTSIGFALSLLALPQLSRAANLTTTNINASGANWTAAIWRTNAVGTSGGPGAGTALAPVAGNTYETVFNTVNSGNGLNNTRIRNPAAAGVQTFPGDSLTMYTNTELRAKTAGAILNFPGVGGNPGLILKGGMLNGGDDGNFPISGVIQVATPSYISHGANGAGGGPAVNARSFDFTGFLTGSGSMTIINATLGSPQRVSGTTNTYSGQWIVQCGWLLGAGDSSLGTNGITVDPNYTGYLAAMPAATSPNGPAVLELAYDMDNAGTLILTNGGQFRLHQNCYFTQVLIENNAPLTPGLHPYSELNANYPANFPAGGSGSITVQTFSPLIVTRQPVPQVLYTGSTAHLIAVAKGSQLTYQWYKNGSLLANGPTGSGSTVSGATSTNLAISNLSAADNATYYALVTTPGFTPIQSRSATLTAATPNGEAYEAAILAATPKPLAFYQFTEANDPSTNAYAFDYIGGFVGNYLGAMQNGFNGITGPGTPDFPGFAAGNNAAQFTQSGSSWVSLPALNLNTNTVTLTAWINPSGPQVSHAGIVFCRSGSTPAAGLDYSAVADLSGNFSLGYHWNNDYYSYSWDSKLIPPQNQWSFVSLVVSPSNAVIYLMNTNGLVSATNVYPNVAQAFDAETRIGNDSIDPARTFNGNMDDVAVFNASLTKPQLFALFSAGSGVLNYKPFIGAQPVSTNMYEQQTARISVEAGGTDPLTYLWYSGPAGGGSATTPLSDGGRMSGTASPTLVISNLVVADSADLLVVVANAYGSVTSVVATLTVQPVGPLENITMSAQQAAGNDWDGGASWSDGLAASVSAVQKPGSTYEVLAGARMRTPNVVPNNTFPGVQLTVDGSGVFANNPGAGDSTTSEIRFKQARSGGIVSFPKLIMNGGQLDLGNDGLMIVPGEIDIVGNTALYADTNGTPNRQFQIDAWLTGGNTNTILWHAFANTNLSACTITGTSNTYSGRWNVDQGILIGTTTNCLGTNTIFVGTNGQLETTYNLANTNGDLVVAPGGKVLLHQNDVFRTAQFGNLALQGGSNYTFATLNTMFPTFFPATWPASFGLTNVSGSGSIRVMQSVLPNVVQDLPVKVVSFTNQTVTFAPVIGGTIPLSFQWKSNGIAIPSGTNQTLVLANVGPSFSANYQLIATNLAGATNTISSQLIVYGFQQFAWYPPTPITTAAATLGQPGTLVGAEAWSSITNTITVLGIPFMEDGSVATGTGAGIGNADFIGYTPLTGDAGFDLVLDGFRSDGGPKTITLNSLAQDQFYSVQLFALDKRNGLGTRRAFFQDPNRTTNVSKTFLMQQADYVVGTFISSLTNQAITMQLPDGNNGNLNALVIRQLPRAPQIVGAITVSPGTTVTEGTTVTLSSPLVYGAGNFTYQWRKGGSPIGGATGTSFVLPAATNANSGSYDVQVTSISGYGIATATAVVLTVNAGAPFFVQQPPPTVYGYSGFPVSIPAVIGGSQPITLQWYLNGTTPVPNATNQTLILATAQAGNYTLTATNGSGGAVSTISRLVVPTAGTVGWIPLALASGSLNQDVVVEAAAQAALPVPKPTTATMDGGTNNTGFTWYEQGFNTNLLTSGLPPAGTTFTGTGDANNGESHIWTMPPNYATNNAVMIDATTNGAFTVSPATGYSYLSLLASTSFGPVGNNWTVYYNDGSTDSGTFSVPDWSGGAANQAFTANGVYSPQAETFQWFSINNPRLYQFDMPVPLAATLTITNIVLVWGPGNTNNAKEAVFAVTASTDGITYNTPLTITGFNQDMVVEAAAGRAERLVGVTTATFDTGLANTGNTLYEQGYNTNAVLYTNALGSFTNALGTGMPPAGSVVTNSTGDHVYVLAPSWIGPNAAFIDAQNSATLTLAAPAPQRSLSFLTSAGNGATTLDYTINFLDGTTQTGSLSSPDWFIKTGWVWDANGRVNIDNATFNNVGVTNANLFGVDVAVVATNLSKTITSIGLKYNSAAVGRAFVFALSGGVNLSANPDSASTLANVQVTVPALANDFDPTGYAISIASVSPTNGTATFSASSVVFTPASNFVGTAFVGYSITNTAGVTASSLITVTVTAPAGPTANPDFAATFWNVPVTIQAVANDSGTAGYSLYVLSVRPTNGTAIISQRTNVVFTPTLGFVGSGTVGYTITNDVTGSASSLITVTVAAPPRPGVTRIVNLGSKVVLTGTNGAPNGFYVLLSSTNVALPVANWTSLATNTFDGAGSFNITNTVNPATAQQFFRIRQ